MTEKVEHLIKALEELHTRRADTCYYCGYEWPCDTMYVAYEAIGDSHE